MGTATVEYCLVVPSEAQHRPHLGSRSAPVIYPREMREHGCWRLQKDVSNRFIHNSATLETIKYSLIGKQNKHIVAITMEYLMTVKKNKLLIHTGCDKSQNHTEQKRR